MAPFSKPGQDLKLWTLDYLKPGRFPFTACPYTYPLALMTASDAANEASGRTLSFPASLRPINLGDVYCYGWALNTQSPYTYKSGWTRSEYEGWTKPNFDTRYQGIAIGSVNGFTDANAKPRSMGYILVYADKHKSNSSWCLDLSGARCHVFQRTFYNADNPTLGRRVWQCTPWYHQFTFEGNDGTSFKSWNMYNWPSQYYYPERGQWTNYVGDVLLVWEYVAGVTNIFQARWRKDPNNHSLY